VGEWWSSESGDGQSVTALSGLSRQSREETIELLWATARPVTDTDAARHAVDRGADVDAAAVCALFNRVGPLTWRGLQAAGVADQAGEIADVLARETVLRRMQAEVLLPHALDLITGPLQRVGLEPLVFKGPALISRYPAPGLRPMDDIDVILPGRQHQIGLEALTRAGWSPVLNRIGEHYDWYLVHPEVPDLPLELHWELTAWRERANNLRAGSLWKQRLPVEMAGVSAFGLPPEQELVALAAHAGKPFHHFNRLVWSVDIAVVVQGAGVTLDWDRVGDLAKRAGCRTVLAVALRHARRLGADVPDGLLRLRGGRTRRLALEPVLDDEWPFIVAGIGTVHRLRYALSDSFVRRVELLVGEITQDAPLAEIPGRASRSAQMAFRRWRRDRTRQPEIDD
jgi:hypothetical protein